MQTLLLFSWIHLTQKLRMLLIIYIPRESLQEEWHTEIMLEKINSSSEYEKTMQKCWADVAEDGKRNSL